jgi:N-acetylglutamate synthase and related acetyltransferases
MDITIYDGIENMDFNKVTEMLSEAIWSKGIKEDEIKQGAVNSALVMGAFCNNVQVGYARVISDKTRFAYIADVYVDEYYRHHGIAKNMMLHILSHESLKDVYQWLLRSAASELYEKVGFVPVSEPERWMEIRQNRRER